MDVLNDDETANHRGDVMSNLRNSQLLHQVGRHPLKAALARCFDIAEQFEGDIQFLQLNDGLSPKGRQDEMQKRLRAAVRDLRDARAPIAEMQAKLDKKRKAVAMPKFDPADTLGFMRRQELRAALRMMSSGQRALHLTNPAFADAMLEMPPVLSGLHPVEGQPGEDASLVETTKEQRLGSLFARELAEIEEMEKIVAEGNMVADLARVDLKLHSGIDDQRVFEEFVKPIEAKQNAPWLKKFTEDGREVIRVVDLETNRAHAASEREILDGKFYKDLAEYQADRAA
jgi:hypothetical protein